MFWGHTVSDLQSDVEVADGEITGSLAYVDTGTLATDWGAGNFIALQFTAPEGATVKVGLDPSASEMPLQELDEDMNGVFKITDKDTQVFKAEVEVGGLKKTYTYDLSGLECAES